MLGAVSHRSKETRAPCNLTWRVRSVHLVTQSKNYLLDTERQNLQKLL